MKNVIGFHQYYYFLFLISPELVSIILDSAHALAFCPLLLGLKEPGVELPDGEVDVTEGGGLDHQLAGGEDLHGGPGLLYLREMKLRLETVLL